MAGDPSSPDLLCYETLDFGVPIEARVTGLDVLRRFEVNDGSTIPKPDVFTPIERDDIVSQLIHMAETLKLPNTSIFKAMYYVDAFIEKKHRKVREQKRLQYLLVACVFISGGRDNYPFVYDFYDSHDTAFEVALVKQDILETVGVKCGITSFEALSLMIGEEASSDIPLFLLKLSLTDDVFFKFPPSTSRCDG
ncbi:hypothetical protein SOVF_194560 [Spinacia oleracea]|uniref:Cyclin N-terminal domain-containing protein n=1 Tax=Spinacia oleracea TaxID=3562 RepID=A0A9R0J8S2_SPIOL|nr:uncharacterized protein LOC110802396 [Spinacia oleracea]KNA04985.1 hypothetical protein SOVF_194560 [Spinacia oleracea]